jgi:hypothetical protein
VSGESAKVRNLLDKQVESAENKSKRGRLKRAHNFWRGVSYGTCMPQRVHIEKAVFQKPHGFLGDGAVIVRQVNMTDDNCPSMRK